MVVHSCAVPKIAILNNLKRVGKAVNQVVIWVVLGIHTTFDNLFQLGKFVAVQRKARVPIYEQDEVIFIKIERRIKPEFEETI